MAALLRQSRPAAWRAQSSVTVSSTARATLNQMRSS